MIDCWYASIIFYIINFISAIASALSDVDFLSDFGPLPAVFSAAKTFSLTEIEPFIEPLNR